MTSLQILGLAAAFSLMWLLMEVIAYRLSVWRNPHVRELLDREQAAHDAFMERLKRMDRE